MLIHQLGFMQYNINRVTLEFSLVKVASVLGIHCYSEFAGRMGSEEGKGYKKHVKQSKVKQTKICIALYHEKLISKVLRYGMC